MAKQIPRAGERLPGCTVRPSTTARGPGGEDVSGRVAPQRREDDHAATMNASQVRRHELPVLIGVAYVVLARQSEAILCPDTLPFFVA